MRHTYAAGPLPESSMGNRITSTSKIPSKQIPDSVHQSQNFTSSHVTSSMQMTSSYMQSSIPNEFSQKEPGQFSRGVNQLSIISGDHSIQCSMDAGLSVISPMPGLNQGESKSSRNNQPSVASGMAKHLQMSPPPKSKKSAGLGSKITNQHVYHPGKQVQGSPLKIGQPGIR